MTDPTSIKEQILEMTAEHMEQLHSIWSLTFEPKQCEDTLHKLKEHTDNFYTYVMMESREKEAAMLDEIAALQNEASDLAKLLHEPVDNSQRPDDMPLMMWQLKLNKSVEHLREKLSKRQAELDKGSSEGELCEELGALPRPLVADKLPLPEEIDGFRDHLDNLPYQRTLRQKELHQLRQAIKQDMKMLELMPQTDEQDLLNDMNHNDLAPETLDRLRQMRNTYAEQVQELRSKINDMRGKIYVLWDRLQETDGSAMQRVRDCTDYSQRTFEILHLELQRCQALRSQNLKTFIEQLRVEISEFWDLTLKSPLERKRFASFYINDYNEDLLELHELVLDDLKSFYKCNKVIFDLYGTRAELWSRMQALVAKANEPKRFNNRAGQLLKEENERKAITSKLRKIEHQITELVREYEVQSHRPFLVYGENILELMAGSEWKRCPQTKQQNPALKKVGIPSTTMTGNNISDKMMMPPPTAGSKGPCTPLTLRNMSSISKIPLPKTPTIQSIPPNMAKSGGKVTRLKKKPVTKSTDTRPPSDADENEPENDISYKEFTPKSRSSMITVGGTLRQRNRLALPRNRQVLTYHNSMALAPNSNTPSKPSADAKP
ncbi:protein regulator of cytokinesis 1-like [Drosophila pseudoobscura]|uniref:Protein regulator of cytokinesis 1-like n=1 Tax=Drosophila pseudoobscura pseudoobscura TaxID=46245 RepID=A0A6I8WEH2_DROPS|nr:protein regulator of cytokinesis 1 [Drosophila pseudoobscura]